MEEANEIVLDVVRNWKGRPHVRVLASEAGLPKIIKDEIERTQTQGETRGVYYEDVAYVIAENNHSATEIEESLLHEVFAHYGTR